MKKVTTLTRLLEHNVKIDIKFVIVKTYVMLFVGIISLSKSTFIPWKLRSCDTFCDLK